MTLKDFRSKHKLSCQYIASILGVSIGAVQQIDGKGGAIPKLWLFVLSELVRREPTEKNRKHLIRYFEKRRNEIFS